MCQGHPPAALADLQRLAFAAPTGDPEIAAMLEAVEPDMTGFATLPREHWQKVWSNNPIERLNREIKRCADVVQTFSDRGPSAGSRLDPGAARH